MYSTSRLWSFLLLIPLLLCGCPGMNTARAPYADGAWVGKLMPISLVTTDGKTVTVLGIGIESGPPQTKPKSKEAGWLPSEAVLVDQEDRTLELDASLMGRRVRVTGRLEGRIVYDREGMRLKYDQKTAGVSAIRTKGDIEQLN